jgi:pilus assembly protein Flp/PilA
VQRLVKFLKDEGGTTAIEYSLIAAGISIAIVSMAWLLGTQMSKFYADVEKALQLPSKYS